jgi:thiol-disulfide isomerase/thioredoxin
MSILQDALKRRDAGLPVPGGLPPPPLPPPSDPHSRRGNPAGVVILAIALLLVGAGLYKVWNDRSRGSAPPAESPRAKGDPPASGPGRVLDQVKSTVKAAQDRVQDDAGNRWPDIPLAYRSSVPDAGARATVYEFWATWCPPCRESLPHLNKLYKDHVGRGLSVVGITAEEPGVVEAFLQKTPVDYPIAYDPESRLTAEMGVRGIPAAFLVDAGGRVVWRGHPMKLTAARLKPLLAPAEAGAAPEPPAAQAGPAPKDVKVVADRVPPPREERALWGGTRWPVLKVNGVLTLGGKANVIIEQDVLGVGEEIRGVRVLRISDNEVTLLFGSEQKTLRTGQSTQPK